MAGAYPEEATAIRTGYKALLQVNGEEGDGLMTTDLCVKQAYHLSDNGG